MLTIIKGSKGTHSIIDMFELLVDTTLFVSRAPCVSRATVDVTLEMSTCIIALSRLVGLVQVGMGRLGSVASARCREKGARGAFSGTCDDGRWVHELPHSTPDATFTLVARRRLTPLTSTQAPSSTAK